MDHPPGIPKSRVASHLAACVVPFLIATLFVLARLYTRIIITKRWGYDDTIITLAWLSSFTLATTAAMIIPAGPVVGVQLAYACRIIYVITIVTSKIAFCTTYLRIFSDKESKIWLWSLLGFTIVSAVPILFIAATPCLPVSKVWDIRHTSACLSGRKNIILTYFTGAVNVFGDCLLLIFIIPRLWPLQMAKQHKIILMAFVSLGMLVIIAALLRMGRVAYALDAKRDQRRTLFNVTLWSGIEANTSLICIAAPVTKPLFRKILPRTLGTSSNHHRSQYLTTQPPLHKNHELAFVATDEESFQHESSNNLDCVMVGKKVQASGQEHSSSNGGSEESGQSTLS